MRVCSIDGCESAVLARGWCSMHYQRWKAHGDVKAGRPKGHARGDEHANWVGDAATYGAVHDRIDHARGKAKTYPCANECGRQALQWAYRGDCLDERWEALPSGHFVPFSLNIDRYDPLCQSCHRTQRPPLLAMLAERADERSKVAA